MFFTDSEIEIAEDIAWKMLDGYNHAYMPCISDYSYFYYNGSLVLDPWMKEDMQGLIWPDHESVDVIVDPISYYGEEVIEKYLVRLFMLCPDLYPKITNRIIENWDSNWGSYRTLPECFEEIDYDTLCQRFTDEEILNTLAEKYPYLFTVFLRKTPMRHETGALAFAV